MAGKSYEVAFQIGAKLASTFSGTFSSAASTMNQLQKQLTTLSKSQSNIKGFESLQGGIAATGKKLADARERVRALQDQMKSASQPTAAMKKEFASANKEVSNLEVSLEKQRRKLGELRTSLGEAGVGTKNLGAEQARLAAMSERLTAAQTRMEKSQGAVRAARNKLSWNNMKGELIASAGILMAVGAPIKIAANFEQAMAKVGAVSGSSAAEMAQMTAQSRQLGRDTQFTATQAAQGQELLARAGFKTGEILAAMPGMLNMAAAEGMELGQAADIASSVLRGFNFNADQSARVADVLAKASAATNTSIAGLGESMKYVAPIAKGLGIPFEDTAAMIGVMGNAGIKGSEAGTALRAALIRLSKEPKQTAKALAAVGVSAKDAQGNMRTMPSLMKSLTERMKGMGKAQKMGELSKIFGTEAASGMLAVMQAVESGDLASVTKEMYAAGGAASEMAQKMNATAQGAMKRLSSATESVAIDIGNVLLPTFAQGAEKLAVFMSRTSQFAQEHPEFTKVIVGSIAALGVLKVTMTALGFVTTALKLPFLELFALTDKIRAAWILADGNILKMAKSTKIAAFTTKLWSAAQWLLNAAFTPWGIAIMVIVGLIALLIYNWEKVAPVVQKCVDWILSYWNVLKPYFEAFWTWLKFGFWFVVGVLEAVFKAAVSVVMAIWTPIREFFAENWESIQAAAMAVWSPISGAVSAFVDEIYAFFEPLFGWIMTGFEKISSAWGTFKSWVGMGGANESAVGGIAATAARRAGIGPAAVVAGGAQEHALGGIFSQPHLGLVAEAGTEAVVPVDNPSLGIPIWKAAGRLMGLDGFGGTKNGDNTTVVHKTYQLSIPVQGSVDPGIVGMLRNVVMDVMNELGIDEERTEFA